MAKNEAREEEANKSKVSPTDQVRAYTLQATCGKISPISEISDLYFTDHVFCKRLLVLALDKLK